jgi:hypothetical protein
VAYEHAAAESNALDDDAADVLVRVDYCGPQQSSCMASMIIVLPWVASAHFAPEPSAECTHVVFGLCGWDGQSFGFKTFKPGLERAQHARDAIRMGVGRMGIRSLVANAKAQLSRGGRMVLLVGSNAAVIGTLEATGIDALIPMYADAAEAERAAIA